MEVGDRVLSNAEAWETGRVQFVMAQGALLLVLVAILWRGARWPRWPIVAWCPVCILANIGLSIGTDIGKKRAPGNCVRLHHHGSLGMGKLSLSFQRHVREIE
jgi:hypothetical protein